MEMKIICSRDLFVEPSTLCRKQSLLGRPCPIWTELLIEADKTVKLTGYDLETGIECQIEAEVVETGSIVINSRSSEKIIKKLPDHMLRLKWSR